ncbi:MAG: hypothetical protein LWX56_09990 [Ignavibacteria bacterium]|nr:hypothetical protein [Ignavibacteria bacterium]
MRLAWLKKIDWERTLRGDNLEIAQLIGIDNFIVLAENFMKLNVYFALGEFEQAAKEYIKLNTEIESKKLARELGVSQRYVQKMKRNAKLSSMSQQLS